MTPDLGQSLIFAAAAGDGQDNFYVVGGRRYDFDQNEWEYQSEARVFNIQDNVWRTLPALPKPMANACLLALGSTLIFSGGAKMRSGFVIYFAIKVKCQYMTYFFIR